MAFTQAAFIRKNSEELRNKLAELGYVDKTIKGDPSLYTNSIGAFYSANTHYPSYRLMQKEGIIDCGENEDLFLALAALRDDSDYMQFFTDDTEFTQCFCDSWKDEWREEYYNERYIKWHKATVEELIEHFI